MAFCSEDWQARINNEIPATKLLQFTIEYLELEKIICTANLQPNKNGHNTGFAGSIYSLGVTCGWVYVNAILQSLSIGARVVAKDANIRYRRPIIDNLVAISEPDFYKQTTNWIELAKNNRSWECNLAINLGDDSEGRAARLNINYHILVT